MSDLALSLLVFSAFALTAGGIVLWRRGGSRKQAVLMLVLAAIMAANVAIWTVPNGADGAPISQVRPR